MIWIEETDFTPIIKADNLGAVIEADETILDIVESWAISKVVGYLYNLYDTDAIFATSGTERNQLLVSMVCKIMLHELYGRLPKQKIPDYRQGQYDETITFLEGLRDAKNALPLPKKIIDTQPVTQVRWGSNTQRKP